MSYARARAALASASACTRCRSLSTSESSLVAVVGRDSSGVVGLDFLREPGLDLEREPGRRGVFSAEPGRERFRLCLDPGRDEPIVE